MDTKIQEALDKKFETLQTELAEAQKNGATKDEIKALHDAIEKSGDALEAFIAAQQEKVVKDYMGQFSDFLIENKDELDKIKTNKSGSVEFVPK